MGYFSELSVKLEEQQALPRDARKWKASDYPAPALQLFWQLEDLKLRLEALVGRDNTLRAAQGLPQRSWRTVYQGWPGYRTAGQTDLSCVLPGDLCSVDEVLSAIAGTRERLSCYGVDADAAEKKQARSRPVRALEGQVSLSLAS